MTTNTILPPVSRDKLPPGWRWLRLGDHVLKVGSGITPTGGQATYVDRGIPLIRSQNVHMNRFACDGLAYITDDQDTEMEGSRVQPKDVLLNITGASIGRVCVVPETLCPANVNQHVSIIRVDGSLSPQFLAYYISSPAFQKFIDDIQAGATRQALTKALIENFRIPAPSLDEQQRIAAVVQDQMATVERARVAAEASLQAGNFLTPVYLRGAFRGITPLSVRPLPGRHPDGWKWNLLRDLARLESGHTPSRYHPEWWGGPIAWLALPDIRALHGKTANDTAEQTNEDGIANSASRVLPPGTVCLSRTASVGFVTIMAREMATSQDFFNWVCGENLEPRFLMYLLMASREYFLSLASGATHQTVYMPTAASLRVCVPRMDIQRGIVRQLDQQLALAEQLTRALDGELRTIKVLHRGLLARAFGGTL